MKLITSNDDLVSGEEYWARIKGSPGNKFVSIVKCGLHDTWKYLQQGGNDKFWASDRNNQALSLWDIIGPIPKREAPNFEEFVK